MDREYALNYTNLYRNHWWWRAREILLLQILESVLLRRDTTNASVLDIGGGEGLFMEKLSQFGSVHACDPLLSADIETEYGPVFAASVDRTDIFPDQRYDLTLLLDVIEHVEDDVALLSQARRVTKKGGIVFVTVPAYQSLWTAHDDVNHHYRRYNPEQLRTSLDRASLDVEWIGALFGWPALVKLVMNNVGKFLDIPFRGSSIPVPIINRFLTLITILEGRGMIRFGTKWGSSLFAVCSAR
jgi:SAM-dependent methyltransferase